MIARQATRTVLLAVLACFLVALAAPAIASAATEFTVDNNLDERDEDLSDGVCKANVPQVNVHEGTCTLRAAIEEVNHQEGTENTINFDPEVFEGAEEDAIFVASLLGALPAIEFPTKIEAGSDCTADGVEGAPCAGVIGLEGEPVFAVKANDTKISGLSITAGSVNIGVYEESTGFEATGNWIGIGLNGSNALPKAAAGILLEPGSDEATIGGSLEADRNVIAFNDVGLEIQGASETTVRGNFFGVKADGETPGPEEIDIRIVNFKPTVGPEVKAEDNEIGAVLDANARASAECDGGCNVISGAEDAGIDLNGGAGPEDAPASGPTTIHGNYVGLDATGADVVDNGSWVGNKNLGIDVGGGDEATVGGVPANEANFVVGGKLGISAGESSDPAKSLVVEGNSIGRTVDGKSQLAPPERGIFVNSEAIVASGDAAKLAKNSIIIEEEGIGIEEEGSGALIEGNDVVGGEVGIRVQSSNNGIGNQIKGNRVEDSEASGILVQNGLNKVFGNEVRDAGEAGILVEPPTTEDISGNLVGGNSVADENAIFDSEGSAIELRTTEASLNEIGRDHGSGNEQSFIVLRPFNGPEEDPNGKIHSPTIGSAGKAEATGTAKPGALVRVFRKASTEEGELGGFLGKATADGSGNWKVAYEAPVPGETLVTATQTLNGGTSSLAETVKTPPDPPKPPPVCPEAGATGCETTPPPDTTKPKVTIKKGPKAKSKSTTAKFVFSSNESGSTFKCKLDNKAFANCTSPQTYKKLKPGKHVFKVKATDKAGNVSTVLTRKFTVSA